MIILDIKIILNKKPLKINQRKILNYIKWLKKIYIYIKIKN